MSKFSEIERKVGIYIYNIAILRLLVVIIIILYYPQIASDYAQQDYQDFAVVIQPFVSNSRSDKFPIEFLSDVSGILVLGHCMLQHSMSMTLYSFRT